MYRWDIINHLAQEIGATSYLEIGLYAGECFDAVQCERKVSIDPKPKRRKATYTMTSDKFFEQNKDTFDIIFVDGLHKQDQTYRDIKNSLQCLNTHGVIVVHDCNPTTERMQTASRGTQCWTGDVWKAWVQLRQELEMNMFVVDAETGCGVIRAGTATKLAPTGKLKYVDLVQNRKRWLNLISIKEFLCG